MLYAFCLNYHEFNILGADSRAIWPEYIYLQVIRDTLSPQILHSGSYWEEFSAPNGKRAASSIERWAAQQSFHWRFRDRGFPNNGATPSHHPFLIGFVTTNHLFSPNHPFKWHVPWNKPSIFGYTHWWKPPYDASTRKRQKPASGMRWMSRILMDVSSWCKVSVCRLSLHVAPERCSSVSSMTWDSFLQVLAGSGYLLAFCTAECSHLSYPPESISSHVAIWMDSSIHPLMAECHVELSRFFRNVLMTSRFESNDR